MDTLSEMREAVKSDLTVGSNSTLFPNATIDLALNRAYRKAGGLFRWTELEDAKKTSAVEDQPDYDIPQTWQPDSVYKLVVDGKRYGEDPDGSPMAFTDFLNWQEDNPNSESKKWAVHNRKIFINPTPTTDGNNNICMWGHKAVTKMTADGSTTIFSYSMPECNEALVLEAVAILKSKGEDDSSSQFKSAQARETLVVAWGKIRQNQQKYEKTEPMFHVDDMFGGSRSKTRVGNFDLNN